ncbi:cytochrome ubiquinol oxidase subunit I, partial [Enterococcus faecium]
MVIVQLVGGAGAGTPVSLAPFAHSDVQFGAVLAGWITTEVGRQPFTVYGMLRTVDSVSPIAAPAVGASLVAFVLVYFAVFGMGTLYI